MCTTTTIGLIYNFCSIKFVPKCMVYLAKGCDMKNSPRKSKSGVIQKYYITRARNVRVGPQLLFYKCFCKSCGWPGEVFQPQEACPRPDYFSNMHKNHSWVMIFNYSKFHWNWSNWLDLFSRYTKTLTLYFRYMRCVTVSQWCKTQLPMIEGLNPACEDKNGKKCISICLV